MAYAGSAVSRTTVHARNTTRNARNVPALAGLLAIAGAVVAVTGANPLPQVPTFKTVAQHQQHATEVATAFASQPIEAAAQVKAPVIAFTEPEKPVIKFSPDKEYYDQLRSRLRWVDIKMGEEKLQTPDTASRILLAQAAARKANLAEVGLNFRDVYGIINAETSWIPRMGASKDGTPNLGIAQFEPATARALGLVDPHDPVESVHIMALHLKDAATWSAKRLAGLKLSDAERALKLREGLSIYYNLSSKGRAMWNGKNTAKLPIETQRHISNARRGAQEADTLAQQLANVRGLTKGSGMMTASFNGGNGSNGGN
ncbi:hypothetical protein [Ramlibacter albus]|uniref:Lytic transglycosylase domain-containing protein n=1 Tax=Ramlibacter albus TaxID=2079448 RepID=A0A923MAU1_9BURK|nr:hypothetical protein [Ramlibacter albus]MBC5765939.1 hypothetical protein [Ramlibacter albus]